MFSRKKSCQLRQSRKMEECGISHAQLIPFRNGTKYFILVISQTHFQGRLILDTPFSETVTNRNLKLTLTKGPCYTIYDCSSDCSLQMSFWHMGFLVRDTIFGYDSLVNVAKRPLGSCHSITYIKCM